VYIVQQGNIYHSPEFVLLLSGLQWHCDQVMYSINVCIHS
jgi:hypothetical protein